MSPNALICEHFRTKSIICNCFYVTPRNSGNMRTTSVIIIIILYMAPVLSFAKPPQSFNAAKKAARRIYAGHEKTIYCGCRYTYRRKNATPDFPSCGYIARKNKHRANRIEWEHVVPAWWLGHQRQCWQHGGRKNCRRTDSVFREEEADLYNLFPSIGEINGDRSNYRYQMIPGEVRNYGRCDFEVDFKGRRAEPRPEIRGDVARVWLYMSDRYGLRLSGSQRRLFMIWDRQDPPDKWELERGRRISKVMGWSNPYLKDGVR